MKIIKLFFPIVILAFASITENKVDSSIDYLMVNRNEKINDMFVSIDKRIDRLTDMVNKYQAKPDFIKMHDIESNKKTKKDTNNLVLY